MIFGVAYSFTVCRGCFIGWGEANDGMPRDLKGMMEEWLEADRLEGPEMGATPADSEARCVCRPRENDEATVL